MASGTTEECRGVRETSSPSRFTGKRVSVTIQTRRVRQWWTHSSSTKLPFLKPHAILVRFVMSDASMA